MKTAIGGQWVKSLGIVQDILLRPIAESYPSQESQIYSLQEFVVFARKIRELKNLQLSGLSDSLERKIQ